jgi:hypothetical protein
MNKININEEQLLNLEYLTNNIHMYNKRLTLVLKKKRKDWEEEANILMTILKTYEQLLKRALLISGRGAGMSYCNIGDFIKNGA